MDNYFVLEYYIKVLEQSTHPNSESILTIIHRQIQAGSVTTNDVEEIYKLITNTIL